MHLKPQRSRALSRYIWFEEPSIQMVYTSWNFIIPRPTNRLSMSSGIEKMAILTFVATQSFHFHSIRAWPVPNAVSSTTKWRVVGMLHVWSVVSREMFLYVDTHLYFYVEMLLSYICSIMWLIFQFTVFRVLALRTDTSNLPQHK